jgi:autotransporter-associated beta strand protein
MRHTKRMFASAIALAAASAFSSSVSAQVLFSDNFDSGTSGTNYDVFSSNPASDSSANFGEEYTGLFYQKLNASQDGFDLFNVPEAPNSPGRPVGQPNRGAVMRINDVAGAVNSMSAYPKSKNFTGDYKLTFDMWITYNGPALGGGGSTEWMLAGINQGAEGNRVAGPLIVTGVTGENTGNTMAVSGEGGSATDYRTYVKQLNKGITGMPAASQNHSNAYYQTLFPSPEYETAGAPGKHWVEVEISQIGGVISWKLNDTVIASYADTTYTSGNITLGYMDVNPTSVPPEDVPYSYIIYDNVVVEGLDPTRYWDINGTTAGAGGATPSGNWDGTAANFNSDIAGGAAGLTTAVTTATNPVIFSAGTDGTGAYTVNVTGTQAAASVKVARGSVTLAGGTIATGAFDVAAGATGTVNSAVTGGAPGTVVKSGAGTLALGAANAYANGTTVSAGTLVVGHGDALGTGSLTIAAGATAQVQAGLPKAVSVASVSTTGSGKLDITNNALVIKGSTLATVTAQIVAGYNNGDFLGAGITSSTAANDPNFLTAVGYASNIDAAYTTFEGVSGLDDNDVLVKYTYYGDADLTGSVDLDDFNLFLAGYQDPANVPQTWIYGDFDYTGSVDLDDFNLFLAAYQANGAPLSALAGAVDLSTLSADEQQLMLSAIAAVPEPGSLGLLGVAACSLLARRKRA